VQYSRARPAWIAAAGLIVTSFYAEWVVAAMAQMFPKPDTMTRRVFEPSVVEATEHWRRIRSMIETDPRFRQEYQEIEKILQAVQKLNSTKGE
jgi:hypothetical protein